MNILFLHGWTSVPGGRKPTHLKDAGHTILNPAPAFLFSSRGRAGGQIVELLVPPERREGRRGSPRRTRRARRMEFGDLSTGLLINNQLQRDQTERRHETIRPLNPSCSSCPSWCIAAFERCDERRSLTSVEGNRAMPQGGTTACTGARDPVGDKRGDHQAHEDQEEESDDQSRLDGCSTSKTLD